MSPLPEALRAALEEILAGLGDATPVASAREVGGGCINNGMRLETEQGVYFLKWKSWPHCVHIVPAPVHCTWWPSIASGTRSR